MSVRIVELTEENLAQAPEWESHPYSCKYCLYWEHPELCGDPETEVREEMLAKKRTWLRRVREEWGGCGKLLVVDGKAVGYAQYAPARFLPKAADYPAGPVSGDAVLMSCLFIPAKEHRGRGLGSTLLSAILGELRERDIAAAETFARRGSPENPSGPAELYLRHGFHVLRDDPEFPLLRLELG
ncbi:GNAT family N-acetyltransferase [Candidatus Bipolaricaulota bacterium]|nr:GNAT family N-acetyltransferase [Candidatus Bipolaricaulota bacterium]